MSRMTRAQALACIKSYAAQNDMASATRIYIENRISYAAFQQAARDGRALRAYVEKHNPDSLKTKAGM